MKSCPLDSSASSSGTPSATDVAVTASCDCKRQSSTHVRAHTRHVVLDLLGPHVEVFFSAREHWWLSQAFLVNKHPSRRCLCTTQHCRDRSRQFCKTLCNVLLTSQLSLECCILSRQRIYLLLQRSHCVFHFWDRVGSHARVESSRTPQQEDLNNKETVTSCLPHVTSRHDHQRVPQLVQRLATLSRDHQK